MRDREEIAYVAGLFEGEGNICTRKDGKYSGTIAVQVRMSDREPLDQLVAALARATAGANGTNQYTIVRNPL